MDYTERNIRDAYSVLCHNHNPYADVVHKAIFSLLEAAESYLVEPTKSSDAALSSLANEQGSIVARPAIIRYISCVRRRLKHSGISQVDREWLEGRLKQFYMLTSTMSAIRGLPKEAVAAPKKQTVTERLFGDACKFL